MLTTKVSAQDFSLFAKEKFVQNNDTLHYRILFTIDYGAKKKYPLVVFLHGTGERGNDNEAQLKWGAEIFLRDSVRRKYPAIVVFPQSPEKYRWSTIDGTWDFQKGVLASSFKGGVIEPPGKLTVELIRSLIKKGAVDTKQITLGGLSMGGFGALALAAKNPDLFTAVFSICGGGDLEIVNDFNPAARWWLFHGDSDNVIDVDFSRTFFQKMNERKLQVKYTEYPGVKHDSWVNAFQEPGLLRWILNKK
jgi:predicted peptidase